MKAKFKVGDNVRILDGSKIRDYTGGWYMEEYVGKCGTIGEILQWGNKVAYRIKDIKHIWDERGLAPAKPETIIIYRNGAEVVALDKTTGKKGIAKCSPKDQFDFMVGAKLAFERLTTPHEEKPVYFTGRVVCIKSASDNFTKGKIYEFKDGSTCDNRGLSVPAFYPPIQNIDDLNARLISQFIEIVE